jgi:hypothetical protein
MVFHDHDAHGGHSIAFGSGRVDTAREGVAATPRSRKVRPIGGWRLPRRRRTIRMMLRMIE